jgi:phosphoglycolate phosphatase
MIRIFRPIPVEQLKLLVFDLDGTLIDSAQDLCNSVNATLVQFGKTPIEDKVVASYIGDGAVMLVRRALFGPDATTIDEEFLAQAYAYFLDYYRAHKLDFTYAYHGVIEALDSLKQLHDQSEEARRTMAVLTNKPVRPARGICEGLGLAGYFLHIYGGDSFPLKKPDPLGLRTLMNEVGATPEETAMIGDSQVDIQTARNAGVWSVGCTFGFGNDTLTAAPPEFQPDILVDSPLDWTAALSPSAMVNPARKS